MHAVVCVKQVPDTSEVRIDPKTNTLIREGVPTIVNPDDTHALEEALRLRDRFGGKVTVISMGPPQAVEALKKCVAFGADEGILLTDRAFAGADTLATSYTLAQAIRRVAADEPVDIVLCGRQAIDGDTGQVGPGVARRLDMPQLTFVTRVEAFDPATSEITVHRKLEKGRQVVKAKLPVVLTVVKELNDLRYPSFPDMYRARSYQPKSWTKNEINADQAQLGLRGSPTKVKKTAVPQARQQGEIVATGDVAPEQAAQALLGKFAASGLMGEVARIARKGEEIHA